MAQDPKVVTAKLKALHGDLLQFVGKEVEALPGLLHDGEDLRAVGSGLINSKSKLLVVTDQRVLIVYKGKDLEVQSFSPNQVEGCSLHKGILGSDVTVSLSGTDIKIGGLDKGQAQTTVVALEELAKSVPPEIENAPADDTLTRLERITSLRDKGALTEEEFAAQKEIILTGATVSAGKPAPAKEKQTIQEKPLVQVDTQAESSQTSTPPPKKRGWLKKVGWIFLILLVISYFGGKADKKEAQQPSKTTEQQASVQPKPAQPIESVQEQSTPAVQAVEYDLLPYSYQGSEDTSTARRRRGRIFLILNDTDETITREKLAATCMAAAKYYANQAKLPVLSVTIYDQPGTSWDHVQLATCNYSSDRGGWSGSDGWTWEHVVAADRTTTATEKAVGRLWTQMRGKYQSSDGTTNEEALSKAIAKKLGIKSNAVHLAYLSLENVPMRALEGVPAQEPTAQAAVEKKDAEWSTKTLKTELRDLLNEFDGFKNAPMFKQCVFGCGSKNPASVWNERREAVYAQMTPKLDAPLQLKAAFGEIWQMVYSYGRGEMNEYKRIRKDVEAALNVK